MFGISYGVITLGRGTGCEIFFCVWAILVVTLGVRAACNCFFCVATGWADTLRSGAGLTAEVSEGSVGGVQSVVVVLKMSLHFWRFWRVTVSSVGRKLSWSVAVSAAVSSCAATSMRASLEAIGILMSYARNHFNVWTMPSGKEP